MAQIDNAAAWKNLLEAFDEAEHDIQRGHVPVLSAELQPQLNTLFESNTQAYREVMIGCILARLQDKEVDVHLPYVNQAKNAYHARALDEEVINPFLKEKQVPSSKGPFLSVFRRNVRFDNSMRGGLRDKTSFDSFLALVDAVAAADDDKELFHMLKSVLTKFIALREASNIALAQVRRLSLPQIGELMMGLLKMQSGGQFPVFLIVATFRTLNRAFNLGWTVEYQGINVADAQSGEAGDVTIKKDNTVLMAAEVTERTVDKARVVSTFSTKIAKLGIQDYLFFVHNAEREAYKQAHQYFSQGHEVNFLRIHAWILNILAVVGANGREYFIEELLTLIGQTNVPRKMKVGWNDMIKNITTG